MSRKTSPWVWVGVGCLTLVVIGVGVTAVIGVLGYRWVKDLEETNANPTARAERVKEILGASDMPPGYYPAAAVSVPFVMELAILSDRERPSGRADMPRLGDRGFVYFKMLIRGRQDNDVNKFLEEEDGLREVLRDSGINIEADIDEPETKTIHRGQVQATGGSIAYVVQEGRRRSERAREDGLVAKMLIVCEQDDRMRFGIWFLPGRTDEGPEAPSDALVGDGRDDERIRAFMSHFQLCRG